MAHYHLYLAAPAMPGPWWKDSSVKCVCVWHSDWIKPLNVLPLSWACFCSVMRYLSIIYVALVTYPFPGVCLCLLCRCGSSWVMNMMSHTWWFISMTRHYHSWHHMITSSVSPVSTNRMTFCCTLFGSKEILAEVLVALSLIPGRSNEQCQNLLEATAQIMVLIYCL